MYILMFSPIVFAYYIISLLGNSTYTRIWWIATSRRGNFRKQVSFNGSRWTTVGSLRIYCKQRGSIRSYVSSIMLLFLRSFFNRGFQKEFRRLYEKNLWFNARRRYEWKTSNNTWVDIDKILTNNITTR